MSKCRKAFERWFKYVMPGMSVTDTFARDYYDCWQAAWRAAKRSKA